MRKALRKNDVKDLNDKVFSVIGVKDFFSKKDFVEVDDSFVFQKGEAFFFFCEGKPVPVLKKLVDNTFSLKKVVVDMGAVKFVVGGADIMRPGIVSFDEVSKNDFVVIVDVNNKKPLAVGLTLFSSNELKDLSSGKVIRNLHYVGDKIWNES